MDLIEHLFDFILRIYPFVIGGLMGYIAVSFNELINYYKKVKAILESGVSIIIDNLDEQPTKREIEKRQKLVPIYLTITSIFIALIKINNNYSQSSANNSTTVSEIRIGFFELLLELTDIIISSFNFLIMIFFLFIVLIIGYYSMLDQNIKQANIFGIGASICFGTILSIDLHLLTSSSNLVLGQLLLLVLLALLMSSVVAFSLVWTSEKKQLKWPVKEQNSNINKEDK